METIALSSPITTASAAICALTTAVAGSSPLLRQVALTSAPATAVTLPSPIELEDEA